MDQKLKSNLLAKDKWIRLLFMIAYGIVSYVFQFVIWLLAVIQFVIVLITGYPNQKLLAATSGINAFMYHIYRYLTFNVDERPYPFSPWPKG